MSFMPQPPPIRWWHRFYWWDNWRLRAYFRGLRWRLRDLRRWAGHKWYLLTRSEAERLRSEKMLADYREFMAKNPIKSIMEEIASVQPMPEAAGAIWYMKPVFRKSPWYARFISYTVCGSLSFLVCLSAAAGATWGLVHLYRYLHLLN